MFQITLSGWYDLVFSNLLRIKGLQYKKIEAIQIDVRGSRKAINKETLQILLDLIFSFS